MAQGEEGDDAFRRGSDDRRLSRLEDIVMGYGDKTETGLLTQFAILKAEVKSLSTKITYATGFLAGLTIISSYYFNQ